MKVKVSKVHKDAIVPEYAHKTDAGCDLHSLESVVIKPFHRVLIPTGIAIAMPTGYEAQVRPRSGLALKHGIIIVNSPGTIDADYRGEIKICASNISQHSYRVHKGERIAQMVFHKVDQAKFEVVKELSKTKRGANGYGSTGTKPKKKKTVKKVTKKKTAKKKR